MYELIDLCGGTPVASEKGKPSAIFPTEQFMSLDPEVIVVAPCGFPLAQIMREAHDFIVSLPGGTELSAVRNNRVYVVDGNHYFNRPGPRIVDSAEILAHCIHPDLFPLNETYREAVHVLNVCEKGAARQRRADLLRLSGSDANPNRRHPGSGRPSA